MLAGALSTLASLALCQVTVSDGNGRYYHQKASEHEVQLTFLSGDSTNATAYSGALEVPASVLLADGRQHPVSGLTPMACAYCSGLTQVSLAEGITTIGMGAFSDCTGLTSVSLPSTLTMLRDLAFYRDSALLQVQLPAVRRIGAGSFAYCLQLDSVAMQTGTRAIARRAFYHCSALQAVTIPGTVNAIGEYAFAYSGLQQVVMEGAPVSITRDVFEGVDIGRCRLVVPSDQLEAYREADVWQDFLIVDGGYEDLTPIGDDDAADSYSLAVNGEELSITANGDAPVLLYDLAGRRIAVAASGSGEHRYMLSRGKAYIVRCGRSTQTIML